ncbi:hypothetical protein FA15DRAFT_663824 [Coprinopsis marcescibilis]|uniref:Transcription factor BYE1 n=1 Tax=Coprinopsis marcescibilis TaxID=230819 RepID=A0A5C3LAH1_COPMA|nr:hypothetical protein FA15DRAFT_663824 [Coprinopsis marcescibilis]
MATRTKAKSVSAAGKAYRQAKKTPGTSPAPGSDSALNGKNKLPKSISQRGKDKSVVDTREVLCTCSQGDNGSPMVLCGECRIWYHFTCVDLAESDADDICFYVCPSCAETTGRRTTRTWEGPSAFETDEKPATKTDVKTQPPKPTKTPVAKKALPDESEEEESSEDEYRMKVDSERKVKGPVSKRRRAPISSGTELDSSDSDSHKRQKRRLRKASPSPIPSRATDIKRKNSTSDVSSRLKRKKSGHSSAAEDPTRKYCLSKLEEMFRDIFFRYPHVQKPDSTEIVAKTVEDMTEDEKAALTQESKQFAADLEQCVFDTFAEPDKTGNKHAGVNYKDRYLMLQFNLSKSDRVVIHQRITARDVTPKDLSLMSPTDLASEETKQSIKIAEQEALEHSILPKVIAPRAKITHKGFEDIEVNGESRAAAGIDPEAQMEAEERRERERLARAKGVQRQRTASMSIPPESPTVMQSSTPSDAWGAPPPVPAHVTAQSPVKEREGSHPHAQDAPELNLADLINIDEEPASSAAASPVAGKAPQTSALSLDPFARPTQGTAASSSSDSVLADNASPPAQQQQEKPTFDLSSLWINANKEKSKEDENPDSDGEAPMVLSPRSISPPYLTDEPQSILSEDIDTPADNEPDFDMLFADERADTDPHDLLSVESMPQVWKGKLSMPLDSSIPQDTSLTARQVGGTPIDPTSLLWKTLFPSDQLRIDGRVPVASSATYLTQMRLSHVKELCAVIFTPSEEKDEASFKTLSDFLVAKGRHGLVFPWGARPKEYHPGKELYIIPLGANEAVPEYMELLDHLKIPKHRHRNYLIGIYVLTKGKLAAPPPPPPPPIAPPVPTTASVIAPPRPMPISSYPTASNTPTPVPPIFTSSAPPTAVPSLSSNPIPVPPIAPSPVSSILGGLTAGLPPGIDPAALKAEIESLTPEQIQGLLALTRGAMHVPPPAPPVPPPQPQISIPNAFHSYPPHPSVSHHVPPSISAPQSWQSPGSPYVPPQPYPAWGVPPPPPPPPPVQSRPHGQSPPRPSHSGERFDRGPHHGDRDNRGYRGKNRGGRGLHSASDRGQGPRDQREREGHYRPVDSGWPRKKSNNQPHW